MGEFSDVTLACEDGLQVEAHKAILASSSPFFLNLLKENQNPHPLVVMTGLKSEVVVSIIDFLYYGETNVDEEHLKSFFAAAEELKLKGLANLDTKVENKSNHKRKQNVNKLGIEALIYTDIKTDKDVEENNSKQTKRKNKSRHAFKEEISTAEQQTKQEEEIDLQIQTFTDTIKDTNIQKKSLSCDVCKRKFTSNKCFKKH